MTDGTDELEPTSELSDRNLCDAISLVWGRPAQLRQST
jgi:hypothetical protein